MYWYLRRNHFILIGDAGYPLNGVYQRPGSNEEADTMRQYFLQLRHETGEFCFRKKNNYRL